MMTPARNAVIPSAPSKYRGSSTLNENVVVMATTTMSTAGQKRALFMSRTSMSGWSQRS